MKIQKSCYSKRGFFLGCGKKSVFSRGENPLFIEVAPMGSLPWGKENNRSSSFELRLEWLARDAVLEGVVLHHPPIDKGEPLI